ncbi:2OG-Fe dioxygenase family protein [Pseudomonas sp. JQ170]|uniref:2OG-Fe dioxygenase family protein n=1 Tax=unclassified Pseudomonas TaxID=196821 RepID=UPI00264A5160|nr:MULTISPECIES: 2OG-Fe dioxygenase family protein [unclassified Pseudomonas]MDN7139918.1 2OG-Fe dioxygenase family protein [Pseudomonas sp. JQ170]WRO73632.1 2OG-Fe dioxygenase family protein [Pseudomonas sp. 170C]
MDVQQISAHLREHHYCHIRDFRALVPIEPGEEDSFRAYWSNLVRDEAFKAYTHRERRILRYRLLPSRQLQLDRNAAFESAVTYAITYRQGVNHLSYCEEGFLSHPLLHRLLATDLAVIGPHLGRQAYTIDIHLFRVRADAQSSSPTTSGIHQDGLDWVFAHFIGEHNTVPVVSEVFASETEHSRVWNLAMGQFLETLVMNDREIYHRGSNVRPLDDTAPAWRDVLLVGLRSVAPDAEAQRS